MRIQKFHVACGALLMALGLAAHSADMSRDDYRKGKSDLAAQLKVDKAACDAMQANAKDVCLEEAKGREKVALAELEARYQPSAKRDRDVRLARAKADYQVAKEKCDDLAGNAKDVCRKEAEAGYTSAKAQAQMKEETAENNQKAMEKSRDAQATAAEKNAQASKAASDDMRDAQYKAAAEKCDSMSGDAKSRCMTDAKTKYGK